MLHNLPTSFQPDKRRLQDYDKFKFEGQIMILRTTAALQCDIVRLTIRYGFFRRRRKSRFSPGYTSHSAHFEREYAVLHGERRKRRSRMLVSSSDRQEMRRPGEKCDIREAGIRCSGVSPEVLCTWDMRFLSYNLQLCDSFR